MTKRQREQLAKAARASILADYCTWLRGWSYGAGGNQLPVELSDLVVAQRGYEQGMEARTAASVKMRGKHRISREELGSYLAKQG